MHGTLSVRVTHGSLLKVDIIMIILSTMCVKQRWPAYRELSVH